VTIEDPIEFLLTDSLSSVTQREIGTDTPSYEIALRNVLRQDPDVIMVGEMRDLSTMQTVLTAAETGHLVFSTVHTNSAAQTIDRIIDTFPEGNHRQIRQQLSSVLQAVVSMKLVEKTDGKGLIGAVEIMIRTPRISKLILEGNLEALDEEIENSVMYHKMQSMNQSLAALALHRQIAIETALSVSSNPGDLDLILRKFLYSQQNATGQEENEEMAEPLSDFSKILELQEIKKAYEELQERHRHEMAEKDLEIEQLRDAPVQQMGDMPDASEMAQLREERDRLNQQVQRTRQEYEAKIERLNTRIRELTSGGNAKPAGAAAGDKKGGGFFRR
jgi:twitching motility protein PilT